jgi:predicted transcriptional regulator
MPAPSKTTIYLDDADYRRLKRLAREAQRPAAELVREAVADYVRRHAPPRRPRSLAAGKSGRPDLGTRAEQLLKGLGRG